VSRIFLFDGDPAGLACHERGNPESGYLRHWMIKEITAGAQIVIPAIVDYEIRRSLILAEAWGGLKRLDSLYSNGDAYPLPISDAALRKAAELWADARRRGEQTAHDHALDGDVILAAQAMEYCSDADDWQILTENVNHIARYVGDRAKSRRAVVDDWLTKKRSILE
jgi:predicted nucleic acid-binding protein